MKSFQEFKEICGPRLCIVPTYFEKTCPYRNLCQKYFIEIAPYTCETAYEIYQNHSLDAKLEKLLA